MALSLSAEQKNIRAIFNIEEQYVIPAYQRPYSWNFEECNSFWNDITSAFESNDDYFLGNIIVARSKENIYELEVIDGQQRLTTILLFLKVVSILYPEHKKLSRLIFKEDDETENEEPKMKSEIFEIKDEPSNLEKIIQNISKNELDNFVSSCKDKKNKFNNKNCKNKFEQNITLFYDWCTYYFSKETNSIKDFTKYFLDRTYLLPIEVEADSKENARNKALMLFETINNRGLKLNDADIFKAKLYALASKSKEEDIFIESWKSLRESCENLNLKIDDIFRYYMHISRGKNKTITSEIGLREFFAQKEISPLELKNYQDILDDLFKIVEILEYLSETSKENNKDSKWIQLINIYTNQYPKIAVVMYLFNYEKDDNDFILFLKNLIRYTYLQGSTTYIKYEIYDIIVQLSISNKIQSYFEEEIDESYFNSLGRLNKGYALLAFYIENDNAINYRIDKVFNRKDFKSLNDSWNELDKDKYVDYLGNFVVLDIPKKNLAISKRLNYFHNSSLNDISSLPTEIFEFNVTDFIKRDTQLKNRLVDFFKGKVCQ